jgi:hypothetical protein
MAQGKTRADLDANRPLNLSLVRLLEDCRRGGTHLRRDTVIPQWFQASKAAAASDEHAVHC